MHISGYESLHSLHPQPTCIAVDEKLKYTSSLENAHVVKSSLFVPTILKSREKFLLPIQNDTRFFHLGSAKATSLRSKKLPPSHNHVQGQQIANNQEHQIPNQE